MIGEIKRMVQTAQQRAMRIVRRGIVKAATTAGFVQVEATDEERFSAELWQQFGFSSRPAAGSEMLLLLVDGNPDQAIAVAGTSRDNRPSGLAAGDAMLWATKSGSDQAQVHAKADGNVDLNCGAADHIHVGGSTGAQHLLLGETVHSAISAYCTEISSAVTVADVKVATATLAGTLGGWLCTKAKGA